MSEGVCVTDEEIINLFFERNENAILQAENKYAKLCRCVSMNILNDERDCEECINDTWITVWNTIPPKRPENLKSYICSIAKNLSLKKYSYNHSKKRNCEYQLCLDELRNCSTKYDASVDKVETDELSEAVNSFLSTLSKDKRVMFLRRYWLMQSVKEIAEDYSITEKNASIRLKRIREQLKKYLLKGGYIYE